MAASTKKIAVVAKESADKEYLRQLENNIVFFEERIAELEFAREDDGWSQLGGDSSYEFSREYLKRIIARSRLYFLHNPLINRGVTLQADYVFAQGINIEARDKDINKVIHGFIDDPKNTREIGEHVALLMLEQTLMVDGNVFFALYTDRVNTGHVQIRTISIDQISAVIRNPDDYADVWYYKREYDQQKIDGTGTSTERIVHYHPDIDVDRASVPVKAFKDGQILWDAPIYQCKVGALNKSAFGVPETYAALDWAQAFKNFLENWATIVRSYARFSWQLTTNGGKNSIVSAKSKLGTSLGNSSSNSAGERNPPPIAGSMFVKSSEETKLDPIKTAGATTAARDGRELRMMVAAALGIPDTFFGDVDVGNLATARTLDRPTELKFRSRQHLWEDAFQRILQYVVKWAILAPNGSLKNKGSKRIKNGNLDFSAGDDTNLHIEVAFPPILEHSIKDRIDAVTEATTLNGRTVAANSPELLKITMRLVFQALGLPDVDDLMKRVSEDIDKAENERQKLASQPQTAPDGASSGAGGSKPRPARSTKTADNDSSDSSGSDN